MANNNNILVSGLVVCALTAISGALIYIIRSKRRNYVKVAKVCKLIIYPVKSLPGVEVDQLDVVGTIVKYGPFRDRSWMLVNSENRFITLRTEPSLTLLKTSFDGNQLWIDGPNLPTLKLNIIDKRGNSHLVIQTKVWGQEIEGIDCGEDAEQWFSKYLQKPGTKLIQHIPELKMRSSEVQLKDRVVTLQKFPIAFQDASGLLLMNQTSIEELNDKLGAEDRVSAKTYKPNILVNDCNSLDEDNWLYIKIRDIEFTFLKQCDRCLLTAVDPDTGAKKDKHLEVLKKYRLADKDLRKVYGTKPLFGVHFGPLSNGTIRCGDDILAIYRNS